MLIQKFKHKLMPRLQDCLNFGIELPISISTLAKHFLSIYKQIQAIDRIKDRTKLLQSTQTSAPTYSSTKIYQMPITNSCANLSFCRLSSSIMRTVTPTPCHLEQEQTRLMKESKCFSCKKRGYTAYDCSKKRKIALSLRVLVKIATVREKSSFFQSRRKKLVCFFIIYARGLIL